MTYYGHFAIRGFLIVQIITELGCVHGWSINHLHVRKFRFKCQTFRVPNLMQMSDNNRFFSFALDSTFETGLRHHAFYSACSCLTQWKEKISEVMLFLSRVFSRNWMILTENRFSWERKTQLPVACEQALQSEAGPSLWGACSQARVPGEKPSVSYWPQLQLSPHMNWLNPAWLTAEVGGAHYLVILTLPSKNQKHKTY